MLKNKNSSWHSLCFFSSFGVVFGSWENRHWHKTNITSRYQKISEKTKHLKTPPQHCKGHSDWISDTSDFHGSSWLITPRCHDIGTLRSTPFYRCFEVGQGLVPEMRVKKNIQIKIGVRGRPIKPPPPDNNDPRRGNRMKSDHILTQLHQDVASCTKWNLLSYGCCACIPGGPGGAACGTWRPGELAALHNLPVFKFRKHNSRSSHGHWRFLPALRHCSRFLLQLVHHLHTIYARQVLLSKCHGWLSGMQL